MTRCAQFISLVLLLALSLGCSSEQPPAADNAAESVAEAAAAQPSEDETGDDASEGAVAVAGSADEAGDSPPPYDSLELISTRLGDLDVMEDARVIRILTVYGPGRYYLDGPNAEGIVAEMATMFEEFINKRLGKKTLKVHVVVIPVSRDQLVPALLAGKGDLVSAGLTITEERIEEVDFSILSSKPLS